MSPTSYQTAPPRTAILRGLRGGVKASGHVQPVPMSWKERLIFPCFRDESRDPGSESRPGHRVPGEELAFPAEISVFFEHPPDVF